MLQLVLACGLFLGIHVFISGTPLRGWLIARLGVLPYRGLFSALSAGALVWMILAYGAAPHVELWPDNPGLKHPALLLNLVAVVLLVLGLTTPNPTSVGQEKLIRSEEPARGIIKVTRHPFLWSVAIWSVAHIMANGALAPLVLFGSLLVLSLVGPFLIDGKKAKADPQNWARLAAHTSWLPFVAMAQGRTRLRLAELGWWRIALGLLVYVAFVLYLHEWLFGLSPLPA